MVFLGFFGVGRCCISGIFMFYGVFVVLVFVFMLCF